MALDATQTSTIGSGGWPLFLKLTIGRLALTSDMAKKTGTEQEIAFAFLCYMVIGARHVVGSKYVGAWHLAYVVFAFLPTP